MINILRRSQRRRKNRKTDQTAAERLSSGELPEMKRRAFGVKQVLTDRFS
jgi:hypothetical protein